MKTTTGLMMCLAFVLSNVRGQIGRLALSPVQKVEQKIGVTDITIVYSRPSKRGRVIFGDLVPYSELWWTGANRNTTIEITEDVIMSPLRKVRIIRKWKILDDIFIFRTSVMPEHQGVENNGNIAKRAVSRYYDFLEWTQSSVVRE